jgi:hypothetical protein
VRGLRVEKSEEGGGIVGSFEEPGTGEMENGVNDRGKFRQGIEVKNAASGGLAVGLIVGIYPVFQCKH